MPIFTPTDTVDMSKDKDWAYRLGIMDWDDTSIVFTKRSLVEFLKYTGVTVDSGFGNIRKLPTYAKFGKITDGPPEGAAQSQDNESPTASAASGDSPFKPTRRVRQAPGGTHTDIFAHEDEGDALSMAPPRPQAEQPSSPPAREVVDEEEQGIDFRSEVKPSRRVRAEPGGTSSVANLWDSGNDQDQFKPTRRVRQGPGGQDSLWNMDEGDAFKPTRRVRQGPGGKDSISELF